MIDVVTFKDKEARMTLTCQRKFLEKCPIPENFTIMELNKDYNMLTYLHNENGPAIIQHKAPKDEPVAKEIYDLEKEGKYTLIIVGKERYEYWIDGHCINREDPETAKKMHRKISFDKKFDEVILGDESK